MKLICLLEPAKHASFPQCLLSILFCCIGLLGTVHGAEPLPAFEQNSTILFIGDSITDGGRARTGNDYNHTMGQSYPYLLSARLGSELAERNLTFINRGISGNRITDLQARWKTDVLDLRPNVLSILVGINDTLLTNFKETPEQFEQIYDQLLKETIAALPKTRIVLGEPFLLPVGKFKGNYESVMIEVRKRQAVVGRLAAKYNLPIIRYQQAFDDACHRAPAEHWCWDGVHPHYAGHGLMAEIWLKTFKAFE